MAVRGAVKAVATVTRDLAVKHEVYDKKVAKLQDEKHELQRRLEALRRKHDKANKQVSATQPGLAVQNFRNSRESQRIARPKNRTLTLWFFSAGAFRVGSQGSLSAAGLARLSTTTPPPPGRLCAPCK